jgi:hypothetical protein
MARNHPAFSPTCAAVLLGALSCLPSGALTIQTAVNFSRLPFLSRTPRWTAGAIDDCQIASDAGLLTDLCTGNARMAIMSFLAGATVVSGSTRRDGRATPTLPPRVRTGRQGEMGMVLTHWAPMLPEESGCRICPLVPSFSYAAPEPLVELPGRPLIGESLPFYSWRT